MTDEKEKKPGLLRRLWTKTKSVAPSAKAGAIVGAAGMAVGGVIAGTGRAGVGLLRLAGRFTFIFVILAAGLHYGHITRQVATASIADPFLLWYIILGVFAAVFFWADPSDSFPVKRTVKFILLAVVAYLLPLLLQLALRYGLLSQPLVAFFSIFTPVLVIYAFMDPGDAITRFVGALYFIFLVILVILQVVYPVLEQNNVQGPSVAVYTPGEVISTVKEAWTKTSTTIIDAGGAITTQVKNGTKKVTKEIYTGQVDNSQQLPLGIQIVEATPLLRKFLLDTGDDVVATATITALTVNEDDVYQVNNKCYLEFMSSGAGFTTKKVRVPGIVEPATLEISYTGNQVDRRFIQCVVSNNSIGELTKDNPPVNVLSGTVVFNTTFEFTTSGYMTYGFMDQGVFNNLRSSNLQPWQEMGLQSPTMIAKYTPGPVMIGMPAETTPYPLNANAENLQLPAFGATFSNAFVGRGGIQKFNKNYLYVPNQITVENSCTPKNFFAKKSQNQNTKYGADYTEYELSNLSRESGEQFVTIRCPMKVTKAKDLIGPGGAGIYTIFLTTNYTYAIDTSVPVTMRFPERASTASAGLQPNINVAPSQVACKNVNPYCTGSANNGVCYCYHTTTNTKLSNCQWAWGATTMQNVETIDVGVGGADSGACFLTGIPSECAKSGISCSGETCRCVYPVSGGSQDCTWDVDQTNAVTCKQFVRDAQ